MLVNTIAGIRLKRLVWLNIANEGEDMTGVPYHGTTRATITVRPPVPLVPKLITDALGSFTDEVSLVHDRPASEVVAVEAATVLQASIENDAPEVIRQAYLSVLAHRVLLAANGGKSFLTKDELPLDPRIPPQPPCTDPC